MDCITPSSLLLLLLFAINVLHRPVSAAQFVFNSFTPSSLLLYGTATIQSSILTLTTNTTFTIGRALYPYPIPTKHLHQILPFSTSFIFSISPYPDHPPGHGFAFLFTPSTGINGTSSSQQLGLLNRTNDRNSTNHVFAVKFDVFQNREYNNDLSSNHIGININSLTSSAMHEAGYWVRNDEDYENGREFRPLQLINGDNYKVWIDYNDSRVRVTIGPARMTRPVWPLINYHVNLSDVFLDQMYVGFTAATGVLVESHRISAWSFSNSDFSIGDALITETTLETVNNYSVFKSKGFIAGITVGCVIFILFAYVIYVLWLRKKWRENGKQKGIEEWELQYWPHRMDYKDIYSATGGFSDENVIGCASNGNVYRGVLIGGVEIAVKRISVGSQSGMEQFLAEISSLGRLKHRNLVGFKGWCKTDQTSLLLIYDYMTNGSLDKWLFDSKSNVMLNWEQRMRILKDVASGILYVHEGWEARVLHRDIKASNVLLDKDMNAKVADFGLARMVRHGELANATEVVGTIGYMAPELLQTGRPSTQTDVYSFGVLVLEVVCGRRAVGEKGIVEWAYELIEREELLNGVYEKLKDEKNSSEVKQVMMLGLRCTNPDPDTRPTMRQILNELEEINGNKVMKMNLQSELDSSALKKSYDYPNANDPRYGDSTSIGSLSTSLINIQGR